SSFSQHLGQSEATWLTVNILLLLSALLESTVVSVAFRLTPNCWTTECVHDATWASNEILYFTQNYIREHPVWIHHEPDFELLQQSVIGQELVVDAALRKVEQHLASSHPPKALVLSFHGQSGIGKTFLAHHLAKAIFRSY